MPSARPGVKGPNSNDTNGGINGTPQPYLVADMTVDPKTNILYIADGYGNRRVLIVDAATGKYIGHFGAYGQNPVVGESTDPAYGGAWAADFRKGAAEAEVLPQPAALRQAEPTTACCMSATAATTACRSSRPPRSASRARTRTARSASAGSSARCSVAPQTAGGTSAPSSFSTDPQADLPLRGRPHQRHDLRHQPSEPPGVEPLRHRRAAGRQLPLAARVSIDSEGNIYTGEVDGAGRVQKFLRYGATGCSGTGSTTVGEYRP